MSFSSNYVSLNSKTAGKDKIYRTLQYGCKLLWYILWKKGTNKEYISALKIIETAMSQTRKVLRFGKSHDMIDTALKTIHIEDYLLRYILTGSSLNQAIYLLLDNALWLNSINVIDIKRKETSLNQYSNKFWLLSIILSLARDLYDMLNLIQNDELIRNQKYDSVNKYILNQTSGAYTSKITPKSSISVKKLGAKVLNIISIICLNKRYHPLLLDTMKNIFDLFIPLSNLKFVNLSSGMQGLCGLISSIIGLMILWDSKLKLKS